MIPFILILTCFSLLTGFRFCEGCGISDDLSPSICHQDIESTLPPFININVSDTTPGQTVLKSFCFLHCEYSYSMYPPGPNKYIALNWNPAGIDADFQFILTDEPIRNFYMETGLTSISFSLQYVNGMSYIFKFNLIITIYPPKFMSPPYNLEITIPWKTEVPINLNTDIIVRDHNLDNTADPSAKITFNSNDTQILIENMKLCNSSNFARASCLYELKLFLTPAVQLNDNIQFDIMATLISDQSLRDVAAVKLTFIHQEMTTFIHQETTTSIYEEITTTSYDPLLPVIDHWRKCQGWDEFGREWEGRPGKTTSRNCPREEAGMSSWECLPNGDFDRDAPNFTNCTTKWIDELRGNWTYDILLKLKNNTHEAKYSNSLEWKFYGHEIQMILDIIKYILKNMEAVEPDIFRVYQDLLNDRPIVTISLLKTMESSLIKFSSRKLTKEFSEITYSKEMFQFEEYTAVTGILFGSDISEVEREKQQVVSFPENCNSNFEESCLILTLQSGEDDLIYAAMKIGLYFHPSLLPGSSNTLGPKGHPLKHKVLNGPLVTFKTVEFTGKMNDSVIEIRTPAENVTINFFHEVEASGSRNYNVTRKLHDDEVARAARDSSACVFWDEENFIWSTQGCKLIGTNRKTSLCYCDHLTYFALLMDIHKYNEKEQALEILTIVLVGLSSICLIFCIITFTTDNSKEGRSPRMFILKHLCISLILANSLMLLVVDRNYLALSEGVCTAVAILTQYIFLTAFLWMGIEGLHLFQNVVYVFDVDADNSTLWKFRLGAFGIPIMIIGCTAIVGLVKDEHVFGGINYCWLEGYYIWSFLTPVAIIAVGNIVSVFVAIGAVYKSHKNLIPTQLNPRVFRFRVRGFLGLTVTLGLSWIFGFFVLIPDSVASTVTAYVFCILTGSQGILVAVFHVLLNKRIQKTLKKNMDWPDFSLRARNLNQIQRPFQNRTGIGITTSSAGINKRNKGLVRNWEDEFN